ncbi:MAG: YncE family protein, partial [Candidatus Angelobacter sp.]
MNASVSSRIGEFFICAGRLGHKRLASPGGRLLALVLAAGLAVVSCPQLSGQTVTATIGAGTNPSAVAVNPATNKIYIANRGSNNVTVIDGISNSVSTVTVGSSPVAVAINPATNQIYVANNVSNDLTVIDGATNSTSLVTVGSGPVAVAVNSATNKIYVANSGSNNVTVID